MLVMNSPEADLFIYCQRNWPFHDCMTWLDSIQACVKEGTTACKDAAWLDAFEQTLRKVCHAFNLLLDCAILEGHNLQKNTWKVRGAPSAPMNTRLL